VEGSAHLLQPLDKQGTCSRRTSSFLASAAPERMANKRERSLIVPWVYDTMLWLLSILVDLFFREIHPRGVWKVPRKGPIIVVAAPHANQVSIFGSCVKAQVDNRRSLSILSF
jgi:hypothetical protein